jgi:hypothetical protein
MKYIVMSVKPRGSSITIEIPFIFPDKLVHYDVASEMKSVLWRKYLYAEVSTLSAGFLNFKDSSVSCFGKSESLGVSSRGMTDDNLIEAMDYADIHS